MNDKIQIFKQRIEFILKDPKWNAFVITMCFCVCSFMSVNNKMLIFLFFSLLTFYLIKGKSPQTALILTYVTSWIFLTGKTYEVILIDERFTPFANLEGYRVFLTISSQFLLGLLMISEIIINIRKYQNIFKEYRHLLLFIFFLWLSNLFSKFPGISSFLSLDYMFWIGFIFIATRGINKKRELKSELKGTLLGITTFLAILSIAQFIHQGALGFQIEAVNVYEVPKSDVSTSLGTASQFRPFGTFSHPSEMGNFILPIAILQFIVIFKKSAERATITLNTVIIGILLIAIVLSQSRSVWLAIIIALAGMIWIMKHYYQKKVAKEYKKLIIKVALGFLPILLFIVTSRLNSTTTLITQIGTPTRLQQIHEAIVLLFQKPLLGTGLGISPLEMFLANPRGVMYGFPAPIHMIYFQLAVEAGVIASILLTTTIIIRMKQIFVKMINCNKNNINVDNISSFFAIVALLINGLFQPIFSATFKLLAACIVLSYVKFEE